MAKELSTLTPAAPSSISSDVVVYDDTRYPLSGATQPEMKALMHQPSDIEMAVDLHKSGVGEGAVLKPGDISANILALQHFMLAFFPSQDLVHFAIVLLGAIQSFFRAKQMGDEEYRRYFFSMLMLRKNKHLHALPSCIREEFGAVFILCGPSGSGKTSFFRQFAARLPKPFVLTNSPMPALPSLLGVWVFPVVHLFYPICGTVKGLVRDMRAYFAGLIDSVRDGDDEHNDEPSLPDMLASEPENAAITACIALNVGMLVLDGAGIVNSNHRTPAILNFLLKLREKSGIPVVLSCTAAFLKSIEHHQTLYANLTNGTTLNLEPIPAPTPPPSTPLPDGSLPVDLDVCRHMCKTWWVSGLLPKEISMPAGLENWVHEVALGNNRFYATAFHSLHREIVTTCEIAPKKPTEYKIAPEVLEKDYAQSVMRAGLFASQGALNAMAMASSESSAVPEVTINYVDYFPTSIIHQQRIADWVTPQKDKPRSRRR